MIWLVSAVHKKESNLQFYFKVFFLIKFLVYKKCIIQGFLGEIDRNVTYILTLEPENLYEFLSPNTLTPNAFLIYVSSLIIYVNNSILGQITIKRGLLLQYINSTKVPVKVIRKGIIRSIRAKYQVPVSYCPKVIAKVKVDNRQTNTICPDLWMWGH